MKRRHALTGIGSGILAILGLRRTTHARDKDLSPNRVFGARDTMPRWGPVDVYEAVEHYVPSALRRRYEFVVRVNPGAGWLEEWSSSQRVVYLDGHFVPRYGTAKRTTAPFEVVQRSTGKVVLRSGR